MSAITISKAFFLSKALQPKTLAKAISLALATSTSTIALAAEVYIDIPSQALGSALKELGQQTGISVLYSPEDVSNLQSTSVQGRYTAESALGQILAGTGVSFTLQDSAYLLVTQSTPSDVSLGPVRTSGQRSSLNHDSTVTENSGSYTTSAISVASKLPTSLKDTPRSVSVISNQQIKDQGLHNKNLEEILRYAPGITLDDTALGGSEDSTTPRIYSRGQRVTNIQIDGINYDLSGAVETAGSQSNSLFNRRSTGLLALPDMMLFDHVEILRGPNSVFSGNGTPSATINMVRKKPLKYKQLQIEGSSSSWDSNLSQANYRGTIDFSSPIPTLNDRLRMRFILSQQDGDYSFQEHNESKRKTAYSTLEFDLTEKTLLGINYSKEKTESTGIPVRTGLPRYHWGGDIGLPARTNITSKQSYTNTNSENINIYIQHVMNDDWALSLNASHLKQDLQTRSLNFTSSNIYEDNSGAIVSFRIPANKKTSQNSLDIRINGQFEILDRKITLLTGVDQKKQHGNSTINGAYYQSYSINDLLKYDWNQYPTGLFTSWEPFGGTQTTKDKNEEIGIYSSIKANLFDSLNIITTVRKAKYTSTSFAKQEYLSVASGQSQATKNSKQPLTPTYSLTYDINKNLTSYISYSESYQDQSIFRNGIYDDVSASYIAGSQLDPAIGKNYELGINGEFLDGRINTYAVIYYMKRTNLYVALPNYNTGTSEELGYTACCFTDTGRQESKGIDIGISGEIYPGLQLSAGYTYNKNKTVSDTSDSTTGTKTHTRTPEHQLKFFSSYQFHERLKDWRVGLGAVIQSSSFSTGTEAEYLGYDSSYIWTDSSGNPTGFIGRGVWSNDDYYANGANGGFNPGNTYTLPYDFTQGGYAIWNGMIEWAPTKHFTLTVNGNNLFDRRYYRTIGTSTSGNYYGEPRNFSLTARATF